VGALQALCPYRVAYLGSTSKSLAQTLRLGWMVLPDELIDPVIDAAGGEQFYVDAINQLTMAGFIASGHYDRHIRRMRTRSRRRRDALVDALTGFEIGIGGLAAGVSVLLTLPEGSEHEVLRRAPARPESHCKACRGCAIHWPANRHRTATASSSASPPRPSMRSPRRSTLCARC
jgi:GntR family transcriptional regulator/MocR family aminotransferase